MKRRRFLDHLWKTLAGLFAAGAALPALVFWWRSPPTGDGEVWVDLGSAPKIPEGEWLSKAFVYERRDRWRIEQARELVYLKRDGRSFRVLSAVCPHTGCLVKRSVSRSRASGATVKGFTCPCHKSFFDADGRSVEGPSPRDLDELEWKVEKRRLKVRYQRFRPGISETVVVEG